MYEGGEESYEMCGECVSSPSLINYDVLGGFVYNTTYSGSK